MKEAIIIAGGFATRLGDLASSTPKSLQTVSGRPFLDYLVWNIARHGIRRIVLATGWLHEAIEAHVGDGSRFGIEAVYSRETGPLGTGGAAALAASRTTGEDVLVANGDGLMDCNYLDLGLFRRATGAEVAIALTTVDDAARFGAVRLGRHGLIEDFAEKHAVGRGCISSGVYAVSRSWLERLPPGPRSLEMDVFPRLAADGTLAGRVYAGLFVEIGSPESLAAAQRSIPAWRRKPCAFLGRECQEAPRSADAIKLLNDAGWLVATSAGQARDGDAVLDGREAGAFTARLNDRLSWSGAHVDASYDEPGLDRAIADLAPAVESSVMIAADQAALGVAAAAGVRGILYEGGDLVEVIAGLIDLSEGVSGA